MAVQAAPGRVVGVDRSAERLAQGQRLAADQGLAIDFLRGDAMRLPVPAAGVDFAWSRFLFQYLPAPASALAELVRVVRPGGVVAVADLDGQFGQFYPLDSGVQEDLTEALRLLAETGF